MNPTTQMLFGYFGEEKRKLLPLVGFKTRTVQPIG
jgi:hypothetical protein